MLAPLARPSSLILFGLWLLPGYFAATRAADAGILHGLLAGLLGMIVIFIGMALAANLQILPFDPYSQKSPLIFIILAGFWGSIGGMIVDIVRLIKAKRAVNEARNHPSGSA